MSFGPELPKEEQERRVAIVTKVGLVMVPALVLLVLFGALGGPHLF